MLGLFSRRLHNLVPIINSTRLVSLSPCLFKKDPKTSDDKPIDSDKSDISIKKITLTEDLPPIPPNLGWPGDEDIKSIFEIKKIERSFKYGKPPHLRRKLNPGPPVIRIIPITHCRNRRFFRIVATRLNYTTKEEGYIEDLGSIDPMPNRDNKIMVALNVERIKYYLGRQLPVKGIIGEILGLAGLLPVHPDSFLKAYKNRIILQKETAAVKEETDKIATAVAAIATDSSSKKIEVEQPKT